MNRPFVQYLAGLDGRFVVFGTLLFYLINHNSFGGSYQLMDPLGYSNMLGMMTWSINWDASNGFQVSRRISQFLHGLP